MLVEDLGVGARQRVEILKVLYRGAKIIILDEPTSVLVPQEVDELFDNLRELKSEGLAVIFISHKLDEVLSVADEVTVIRRGATIDTVDAKSVNSRQLAEMMVGSELPNPSTETSTVTDRVVLEVKDINLPGPSRALLTDIDLVIHAGEILGIAGVEGNGQAELVESIMGVRVRCVGHRQARRPGPDSLPRRATGARPASATSPRTGTATASCSTRRCGRTASWVTRRVSPTSTVR